MQNGKVRFLPAVSAWLFFFAFASVAVAGEELFHCRLTATPFTAVELDDAFWMPRLEINRTVSLP